jgi:hypothetical protein
MLNVDTTCPECGACVDKQSCAEALYKILAMEPGSPCLTADHFKTVACYIIQHPATYTHEAVEGLVTALRDNLNGVLSVDEIRKLHGLMRAGKVRVKKRSSDVKLIQRR